jgi:hypothetical protein
LYYGFTCTAQPAHSLYAQQGRFFAIRSNSLAIVFAVSPVRVPILKRFLTRRISREYKTKKIATKHLNGRAQQANILATITCLHARFGYEACF